MDKSFERKIVSKIGAKPGLTRKARGMKKSWDEVDQLLSSLTGKQNKKKGTK